VVAIYFGIPRVRWLRALANRVRIARRRRVSRSGDWGEASLIFGPTGRGEVIS